MRYLFRLVLLCVLLPNCVLANEQGKRYASWDGLEADKLATIWLIKRFIDPSAQFVLYPKGQVIYDEEQFDTPDAAIKRSFKQSTFESMLAHYELLDPKLSNIGKLIHDIEINTWETKLYKKTPQIEIMVLEFLNTSKNNDEIIEKARVYFDKLYQTMPSGLLQKVERD